MCNRCIWFVCTNNCYHHEHLQSLRAIPFLESPNEWLSVVKSRIDVVLETVHANNYQAAKRAVKRNGKLVCSSKVWRASFFFIGPTLPQTLGPAVFTSWLSGIVIWFFDHIDSYPTKPRVSIMFITLCLSILIFKIWWFKCIPIPFIVFHTTFCLQTDLRFVL